MTSVPTATPTDRMSARNKYDVRDDVADTGRSAVHGVARGAGPKVYELQTEPETAPPDAPLDRSRSAVPSTEPLVYGPADVASERPGAACVIEVVGPGHGGGVPPARMLNPDADVTVPA